MSVSETDITFVRRAISNAMRGRGSVEPNPMVGCVIVKDNRIIGEGIHEKYGAGHAEPNALKSCVGDPRGATAYVTLEPCCHLNKQTPPCAPRLIAAGISRVVIGCLDPNPDVNGKGVAMLRAAGIVVDGPVAESEAKQLIAPFLARVNFQRPYVTLKWAESADGKVAGEAGRPVRISNGKSDRVVQELRSRCDSIIVGIGTVLKDDPMLTVRDVPTNRKLARRILDSNLRIPLDSKIVKTANEIETTVYCYPFQAVSEKAKQLEDLGVEIIDLDPVDLTKHNGDQRLSLTEMFLYEAGSHLLVECGPTLARAFFERGLWDRAWQIKSPNAIEIESAPAATQLPSDAVKTGAVNLMGDLLTEYLNPGSNVYLGQYASADLSLIEPARAIDFGR